MNKRKIRDCIRFWGTICFSWLYLPHCFVFFVIGVKKRKIIISDLHAIENQINIKLPLFFQLLYQLHTNRYFRGKHSISRLDAHYSQTYLCAITK